MSSAPRVTRTGDRKSTWRSPVRMPDEETHDAQRTPFSGSDTRVTRVLGVVLGEQLPLFVLLREQEEDDHCPQQDGEIPAR